jgi:phospholipid/cholesterol/gamma-HCH transport system substrate-binding protein
MTRGIAVRLLALVLAFVLGLYYIVFHALGVDAGAQPYDVTVTLPTAGGLYAHGSVTYRGVQVGTVRSVRLTARGVVVTAAIRHRFRIPDTVTVKVHDLSAAGEEYLDFVPSAATGAYLHRGSVVAGDAASIPTQVGTLLQDVGRLSATVSPQDISTVTTELGTGMGGTGDDLQSIVQDTLTLVQDLHPVQPATIDLLNAGTRLLPAIAASGPSLTAFSAGLQTISAQLAASDVDVRSLLANGAPAAQQVQDLLTSTQGQLSSLLRDSDTVAAIGAARQPAWNALLTVLPTFGSLLASMVSDGRLQTFIYINNDAPVCSYGGTIPVPTAATGAPDLTKHCTATAPNLEQRGAQNAPRP